MSRRSGAYLSSGQLRAASINAFAFSPGDVVANNYEIRSLVGAGAMAQVYEAHDRELNRKVALKVVTDPANADALRREGRALAAIRDPSVVSIYTTTQHAGLPILVLERVYGRSLEALLNDRRRRGELFTLIETVDLLLSVSEAVVAVHRAGVAHRDVKPANVMLAPGGRVVLTDFGLVLPHYDRTELSRLIGSLEYMAPEALAGKVHPSTVHLLDIYALGILGYQLLTGIVPYGGRDGLAIAAAQLQSSPPPIEHLRRDSPRPLRDLIRALMAIDPAERPQSAEAVLWQLRGIRSRLDAGTPAQPFSVLIVDDDASLRELFSLYLRAAIPDAEIASAPNGQGALRAIKKKVPDLMLLDLELQDINGAEVCMYLRGMPNGARCRVVATSKDVGAADEKLLQKLGVACLEPGIDRITSVLNVAQELHAKDGLAKEIPREGGERKSIRMPVDRRSGRPGSIRPKAKKKRDL